jgi:hypothetical protein
VDLKPRFEELAKAKLKGIETGKVKFERKLENKLGEDSSKPLQKLPHPDSDFSHVDPGVLHPTNSDRKGVEAVLETIGKLREGPEQDAELLRTLDEVEAPLKKLGDLLSENPLGLQRLALVFEWILCNVTTLLGEINLALTDKDKGKDQYERARMNYLQFLDDLDDREPRNPITGERGYGKAVKWACINPSINGGRIVGVEVQVKWNPHISSSGVPIQH